MSLADAYPADYYMGLNQCRQRACWNYLHGYNSSDEDKVVFGDDSRSFSVKRMFVEIDGKRCVVIEN